MISCGCVGLNVGWSCSAKCKHCFYRRDARLGTWTNQYSFEKMKADIDKGKEQGCNRVTAIGEGEPMLNKDIKRVVEYCTSIGMATNIITTGVLPPSKYEDLFNVGLNHLQFSCHHLGDKFDEITELPGAYVKQRKTMDWCKSNNKPFRTNTTVQQLNYRDLETIVENLVAQKPFHISLLGFLPHYEWKSHSEEVIVHPAELRPHIEKSAQMVLDAGILLTIRYHPLCHLDPKYWPYVTNALYVVYDPMEWYYNVFTEDVGKMWDNAEHMRDSVCVKGEPCDSCAVKLHCGAWNKTNVEALSGAGLRAIRVEEVPAEYRSVLNVKGGIFDMSPTNHHTGIV